jgi:hypothetical protein
MHDKEKLKIQKYIRGCNIIIFDDGDMDSWDAIDLEAELHELVFKRQFQEYCLHAKKKDKKKW